MYSVKILKMGPKLGIYFKEYPEEIKIGDLVEILFYKNKKKLFLYF